MRWPLRRAAEVSNRCGTCLHFQNAPEAVEAAFANLSAMSSGYASVRAGDGICRLHDIYLSARATCPDFAALQTAGVPAKLAARR